MRVFSPAAWHIRSRSSANVTCSPRWLPLLMSLESVFAALFGWLLLGQTLSARELFGCAVMFAAIILSQLPERQKTAV